MYLVINLLFFYISTRRRQKKKIRRILDDAELGEETRRKIAIEKVPNFWLILFNHFHFWGATNLISCSEFL